MCCVVVRMDSTVIQVASQVQYFEKAYSSSVRVCEFILCCYPAYSFLLLVCIVNNKGAVQGDPVHSTGRTVGVRHKL